MSSPNGHRTRVGVPSHHSYLTSHGLEVLVGSDIARVGIPAASALNATLLDGAAGHLATFGVPPNEFVCLSMGIRFVNGAWQYEAGVTTARVIRLDPGGLVGYWLVTGSPMVWTLQSYLDGSGNFYVAGSATIAGPFVPTILYGGGPNSTVRAHTSLARYALGHDLSIPSTDWQTVPFDTVIYDTAGYTGHLASAFIVPIPGYYTMHGQVTFGGNPGNTVGIRFMLADQQTSQGGMQEGFGLQLSLHSYQTLYCTPGDAIWMQYKSFNPDFMNGSGFGWTFMEIHYQGE